MDTSRLLDDITAGAFDMDLPNEEAFKRAWQTIPETSDPYAAALRGGLLADRLSWVFLAAYQSAVRACFPGLPSGKLASFAASEDRNGEFAGTSIDHKGRLQGNKSWIATSRCVDLLIVTVGSLEKIVLVASNAPGVSLKHRDAASFLGDMSQGMASFVDVDVGQQINNHAVENFGVAEPFFVTVASCGYLLKESQRLGLHQADDIVGVLSQLEACHQAGFERDLETLLACYELIKSCGLACSEAAEGEKAEDWQANGRLLGIYGKGLRARV